MVISTHFSKLPDLRDQYLLKPDEQSENHAWLIHKVVSSLEGMPEKYRPSLPSGENEPDQAISNWIRGLMRLGRLTLVVDGLDEIDKSSGEKKARALRLFLEHTLAFTVL